MHSLDRRVRFDAKTRLSSKNSSSLPCGLGDDNFKPWAPKPYDKLVKDGRHKYFLPTAVAMLAHVVMAEPDTLKMRSKRRESPGQMKCI